ncbi:MAG: hypothetical protein L3J37_04770 [Rhodobacteraceae bacterium]|nr:hypothetical protein [Paracoccaceae bacterium]
MTFEAFESTGHIWFRSALDADDLTLFDQARNLSPRRTFRLDFALGDLPTPLAWAR